MKVFVVIILTAPDSTILGVYTSEAEAEISAKAECRKLNRLYEIEEFELKEIA